MAEDAKPVGREPGAPIPKDEPDPELIKLRRARPKVSIVTAAGIVFLCAFFLWKLNPDRRFSGAGESPRSVTVADVVGGKVEADALVAVEGEPLMSHAIRASTGKGGLGMRVAPIRGSGDKLWVVLPGDGWADPKRGPYVGRLRELDKLPFAKTITEFLAAHPRPLFATAAVVRAAFGTGKVSTVSGDTITVRDSDRVGFDVIDPDAATIVCTYGDRHENAQACATALEKAGITTNGPPKDTGDQARFDIAMPGAVPALASKLEAAALWAVRVDPVTRHHETTWGALKASGPAGFTVDKLTIPDAQLDLVGLYVTRSLPSDAFALLLDEKPADYWYVLPVTIVVGLIGLLFLWALVRAIRREVPASA